MKLPNQNAFVWRGEVISDTGQASIPSPGESVRVMIGGTADKAVGRTVRWAQGWTAGGAGPEQAAEFARRVREAWKQSGRKGRSASKFDEAGIDELSFDPTIADLDQIDRLAEAVL